MTVTSYNPVSFTSDSITAAKLQQQSNNIQWLFENAPRVRYNSGGIVRDGGLKVIAGKTPHSISPSDYGYVRVQFGSYFSPSCKPVIVAVVEAALSGNVRRLVTIQGLDNTEADSRGFMAHITSHQKVGQPNTLNSGGWLHWMALGW